MSCENALPEKKRYFSQDLTPVALCRAPFDPDIHDAEKRALADKIRETLVSDRHRGNIELPYDRMNEVDYRVHVVRPIRDELAALGWFTQIMPRERGETAALTGDGDEFIVTNRVTRRYFILVVDSAPM